MGAYIERTTIVRQAILQNGAVQSKLIRILDVAIAQYEGHSEDGQLLESNIDGKTTERAGSQRKVYHVDQVQISNQLVYLALKVPSDDTLWMDSKREGDGLKTEIGGLEAKFDEEQPVPYFCLVVQRKDYLFLLTEDLTANGEFELRQLPTNVPRVIQDPDLPNHVVIRTKKGTNENGIVVWTDLKNPPRSLKADYRNRGQKYLTTDNILNLNQK